LRRLGSAALDICYVACGRFEAFWEQNLKPWDTAAATLIAAEAGATVTTFANRPYSLSDREILVTNGRVQGEMLDLLDLEKESE
jgi:myo-inositol-1(or 4)-monophosphatase